MKISKNTRKIIEQQFYLDCNLQDAEEIKKNEIFLSRTKIRDGARIVDKTDGFFRAILYAGKAYLMVDESIYGGCKDFFKDAEADWFCKFHNLRIIDQILKNYGYEIADTRIYFLPDEDALPIKENKQVLWFDGKDLNKLREKNLFTNALCHSPTQPDYLAVAAVFKDFDGKIVKKGVAAASLDGKYTRQIGVDVLENYRGQGIATYLVTLLKQEILKQSAQQGKKWVPFYGTSESHSISREVAVKAGFLPSWCEIYVKKAK